MTRINGEEIHSVDTIGSVLARNGKRGHNGGLRKSSLDRALDAWLIKNDHATRLPGEYGTRSIYPCGKQRPRGQIVRIKRTDLSRAIKLSGLRNPQSSIA